MIIDKLIVHHLRKGDDRDFYRMQAQDAVEWIRGQIPLFNKKVLDVGCGAGMLGEFCQMAGAAVTFSDLAPERPELKPYVSLDLQHLNTKSMAGSDLVICSNVLEHLRYPWYFLDRIRDYINPGGYLYLSWTPWLSPWGGHEYSPLHYLGATLGQKVYDTLKPGKRIHTVGRNLFKTSVSGVLLETEIYGYKMIRMVPRYYPEFAFLTRAPVVREFLTWNCAMLLQRQ